MARLETEELTEILLNAALSRALCTAAELGIADKITAGAPESVESLAAAAGAHERSLYRMLRFLASHGVFEEKDGRRFDHTRLSQCLKTGVEGSFRAAAQMFHRMFPGWDGMHHTVMTGEPGFNKVFGQPVFAYLGTHPDVAPIFDAGMTAFHGHETAAMLDAYDFSGIRTLADIGGGNGSLIAAVLLRYPHLKGIMFDLGHVTARARARLHASGAGERCTVLEGSFFEAIPAGADAYVFRHIIHDWTDEQSVAILKNCRKAIPAAGRLLVVETIVEPGNGPSLAKGFDMTMMTFPGGIERTAEEYKRLFAEAGFHLKSITPTASAVSVIEGAPSS